MAKPRPQPATLSSPAGSARDRAIRAVARQAARRPDLLPMEPETAGLSPRDAAFCHAIYDSVLRHWITLEFILDRFLSTPVRDMEPAMQAVLLVGAAQIVAMDAVPPHAAVDESVNWAKASIREGAGGLANAVLRKVSDVSPRATDDQGRSIPLTRAAWTMGDDEFPLAGGRSRVLRAVKLPADPISRAAIATSHPRPLIEGWEACHGRNAARDIAHHNLAKAPTIVNACSVSAALAHRLRSSSALSAHAEPGHFVFTGHESALSEFLASTPGVWVQDPSSSQAVQNVADLACLRIVDLCAGRGTKTRQLRATFPQARIIATDTDDARRAVLEASFRGDHSVLVCTFAEALERAKAAADLVLLDVPCSNTGVLARRLEAKHRASAEQSARLIEIQREILTQAQSLLKPTGAILYATCSIEKAENQSQASWAAGQFALRVSRERWTMPSGFPAESPSGYRDGSYSVLLARPSGPR